MVDAMTTMPTVGMHLDAMIAKIDQLPSTQLYGLIVAVTVGLCVVLLGTGNSALEIQQHRQQQKEENDLKKPKTRVVDGGKQPKWHLFKWINYVAVAAFLYSVFIFCSNASQYLHHESQSVLVQFLVGWSIFLMYFFGFFGISLIHEDIPTEVDTVTRYANYPFGNFRKLY